MKTLTSWVFPVVMLWACAPEKPASERASRGQGSQQRETMVMAMPGRLSGGFTPMHLHALADTFPVKMVYQPLVGQAGVDQFFPLLAESWQQSSDLQQLTLQLRAGVKWHDGETFDADDVRFTIAFLASPGFHPRAADYYAAGFSLVDELVGAKKFRAGQADAIDGVEVLDPLRLRLRYRQSNPEALAQLSRMGLIAEHRWQNVPPSESFSANPLLRQPVGTGPYRVTEYKPESGLWLEAFPDYWNGKPHIERMVYSTISEHMAQAMLLKEQLQFYRTSNWDPAVLAQYRNVGLKVESRRGFSIRYIGVNHQHPLLGQEKVRQALLRAIDREEIVHRLFYDQGEVVNTAILPEVLPLPAELETYPYDPERAKSELQALGWQWREGQFYLEGKPVELELKMGDLAIYREMAPVIQHYLKQVGVSLRVVSLDFAAFLNEINEERFEMFLLGSHVGTSPAYGEQLFTLNTGSDFTNFYRNAEVDDLYRRAAVEVDRQRRQQMYQRIASIFNRELPWLFLLRWNSAYVLAPQLQGVKVDRFAHVLQGMEEWQWTR